MLHIDRCVCTGCSFSELRALADKKQLDFKALSRETGCGMGCGLCVPYIQVMLKTGQTVFNEMLPESTVERPVRDTKPRRHSTHRTAGSAS